MEQTNELMYLLILRPTRLESRNLGELGTQGGTQMVKCQIEEAESFYCKQKRKQIRDALKLENILRI